MACFGGKSEWLVKQNSEGKFDLNYDVVQELERINSPCVVVSIIGKFRTGKSYLMNRIAGVPGKFGVVEGIKSITEGMRIWVTDHPQKVGTKLILLDTEGLGNPKKGSSKPDEKIFMLVTILSSVLIYNVKQRLCEDEVSYLSTIAECVKILQSTESNFEGLEVPTLVVAVRDFQLGFEGKTSDEYLEELLETQESDGIFHKDGRNIIKEFFQTRRCFSFDSPGNRQVVNQLEKVKEELLSEDFVKDMSDFLAFIYKCVAPRILFGKPHNGAVLANLIKVAIKSVNSRESTSVENVYAETIKQINNKLVEDGLSHLEEKLGQLLPFPTKTMEKLDMDMKDLCAQCKDSTLSKCAGGEYSKDELKTRLEKLIGEKTKHFRKVYTERIKQINDKLVEDGLNHLEEDLRKCLVFPTETRKNLDMDMKDLCTKFKDSVLRNCAGGEDTNNELATRLEKQIRKKTAQFHKENEDKSKFSCEIFLEGMDSTLVTDIKNKVYVVKGGYEGYKRKMEAIKQKYTEKAGLGLKRKDIWKHFEGKWESRGIEVKWTEILEVFYLPWRKVCKELIDLLEKRVDKIDGAEEAHHKGQIVYSGAGFVGSALTVGSLLLAPATGGLSLAVGAAGFATGVTSGIIGASHLIIKEGYLYADLKMVKEKLDEQNELYKQALEGIKEMQKGDYQDTVHDTTDLAAGVKVAGAAGRAAFAAVDIATDFARMGVKLAAPMAGILAVVEIGLLAHSSNELAKEGHSERAQEVLEQIESVKETLKAFDNFIRGNVPTELKKRLFD